MADAFDWNAPDLAAEALSWIRALVAAAREIATERPTEAQPGDPRSMAGPGLWLEPSANQGHIRLSMLHDGRTYITSWQDRHAPSRLSCPAQEAELLLCRLRALDDELRVTAQEAIEGAAPYVAIHSGPDWTSQVDPIAIAIHHCGTKNDFVRLRHPGMGADAAVDTDSGRNTGRTPLAALSKGRKSASITITREESGQTIVAFEPFVATVHIVPVDRCDAISILRAHARLKDLGIPA